MSPLASLVDVFAPVVNFLSRPEVLFFVSIAGLLASLKFAHVWTKPPIALAIAAVGVLFCGWSRGGIRRSRRP
jgi:hypothetical protein